MESGEVTERVALLSHQLSMMETSAAYDAITRVQLQENIATLEYENERLAQEARQQREDAVYHRDFFYRLLEATDQLNLTIGDIHQDYIRTVNVSMFPKHDAVSL
jgi:demethoxyubiquinone hydroxylase (CLK1/Coq7/Cat5 family)